MSSTQEKLGDSLDELYSIPGDCPKELRQNIGFLRQFVNEERHGEDKDLLKSSEIWHFLKEPIQALIDSAKREGAIEEVKMLQQKAEFMEQAGMNFKPAAHAHNRLIMLEQSEESI